MNIKMMRCPFCGEWTQYGNECAICKNGIGIITTEKKGGLRARIEYDKVSRITGYPITVDDVPDPIRSMLIPKVKRIEILNPEKVLRFTFCDGTQIKTICSKEDKFDPELACYIAYAKMLNKRRFRKAYNAEGIVNLATQLRFEKCYEKLVNKAMKIYVRELEEYNSTRMVLIDGESPRDIIDKFIGALKKSGV